MFSASLRIILGFALACLAAAAAMVAFVITPVELMELAGDSRLERLGTAGMLSLAVATHSAIFALPFALVVAGIAAVMNIRSLLYYVFAGVGIALLGFYAQSASEASGQPTIVNEYALIAFAVAGLIGGMVYWYVAVPDSQPFAPVRGRERAPRDDPKPSTQADLKKRGKTWKDGQEPKTAAENIAKRVEGKAKDAKAGAAKSDAPKPSDVATKVPEDTGGKSADSKTTKLDTAVPVSKKPPSLKAGSSGPSLAKTTSSASKDPKDKGSSKTKAIDPFDDDTWEDDILDEIEAIKNGTKSKI